MNGFELKKDEAESPHVPLPATVLLAVSGQLVISDYGVDLSTEQLLSFTHCAEAACNTRIVVVGCLHRDNAPNRTVAALSSAFCAHHRTRVLNSGCLC